MELSTMDGPAKIVTYIAAALMALTAVIGGLFAAGSAFSDLETGQAIGTTAPWVVLALALSAFAYWSRRIAPWVFAVLTVLVAVRIPIEFAADLVDRDDPFTALAVLVLAVALGVLGLHHPRLAGSLLAVLGTSQLIALMLDYSQGGAGIADLLTTSTGAVVIPILVVAALFLLAGTLEHTHHGWHTGARPAHFGPRRPITR